MKRFLYSLLIVAIIATLAGLAYFFRYRAGGGDDISGPNGTSTTNGGFPIEPGAISPPPGGILPGEEQPIISSKQKFGLVAQNKTADYFIDKDNAISLIQPDGQVVQVRNGQTTTLSSTPIANLAHASFSQNGQFVLATFGGTSAQQQSVFGVVAKSWQPLDPKIKNPAWSPSDSQIAYLIPRGGRDALETLDVSKTQAKPKELFTLHGQDLVLDWLNANQIMLGERASARVPSSLWRFDIKNKTLTPILVDQTGLETTWNASGTRGVMMTGSVGAQMSLVDQNGTALRLFTFFTLPSKCLFRDEIVKATSTSASAATSTGQFLYCAVPRDTETLQRNQLPDAYQKRAIFTSDDFYKINLADGSIAAFFKDESKHLDAYNLKFFNNRIFFVNRFDEKLYAISLEE